MTSLSVDSPCWIPASTTQARFSIPGELMYGNGKAVWLPVTLASFDHDQMTAIFVLEWDPSIKIKAKVKDAYPRSIENGLDLQERMLLHPNDLINLANLSEASILYSLGFRYKECHFMTKVGRYFISVNPAHALVRQQGCYIHNSNDIMAVTSDNSSISPYAVAQIAKVNSAERFLNQSIILRGCSGSGKTELSKYILEYILYTESGKHTEQETKLENYAPLGRAENPLFIQTGCRISKSIAAMIATLDFFCGAGTDKNINSSRSLRWTKIFYNKDGKADGAEAGTLFFDSSRLSMSDTEVCPPFKIFSLLAHGLPPEKTKDEYTFNASIKEALLGSRDHGGGGIDTVDGCQKEMMNYLKLMEAVGLDNNMMFALFRILAAVVHLQRLEVSGGDGSASFSTATKGFIVPIEKLLGLESGSLGNVLLKKTVEISGSKNVTDLSPADCKAAINTLSSELYQRVLQHILRQCATYSKAASTSQPGDKRPYLQVVDPSGNEWLEQIPNRLQQFCINMMEEKMQEFYLQNAFQKEIAFLRSEGVDPPSCDVKDSDALVMVVERPPQGIVSLIEEACLIPRGNDVALLDKIFSTHSKSKLVKTADRQAKNTCFIVKHSFGDVQYDVDGFVVLNKERPTNEVNNLLDNLASSFNFLETDASKKAASAPPPDAGKGSRSNEKAFIKASFLANKARDGLNAFLQTLAPNEEEGIPDPITIMCLKASNDPRAFTFDPNLVINQVRYFAITELTDFCRKSFSLREVYYTFYDRYRLILPYHIKGLPWKLVGTTVEKKVMCKQLITEVAALDCIPDLWSDESLVPVFGNNYIFLRLKLVNLLEGIRSTILKRYSQAVVLIQAGIRCKLGKNKYEKMKTSVLAIQSMIRMKIQRLKYTRVLTGVRKIQGFYLTKYLSRRLKRMKVACGVIRRRLLDKMIQRLRYKRLQRATRALQYLAKGFMVRNHINHVLRSVLKLQHFAKDFLRRNRIYYFKKVAVVRIQRFYRGAHCRHVHRAISRVLKIRRNQRRGTRAVLKMQALWRRKRIIDRFRAIVSSTVAIQRWARARKIRFEYLQVLYLTKWLQCTARRVRATNEANVLRVREMIRQERINLEKLREKELEHVHVNENDIGQHLGGGFYKNNHQKYGRFLIGLDVLFDLSSAYPNGWLNTVIEFDKMTQTMGQRRLSKMCVGRSHTVFVDSAHNVYTVGLGDNGQLGHGNKKNEIVPRRMETLTYRASESRGLGKGLAERIEVKSICAGRDHTLLLTESGNVYSWGANRSGQLGHSHFEASALPRLVIGIQHGTVIMCGAYHSACLAGPGLLYTWGCKEVLGRPSESDSCEASTLPFFIKRRIQLAVSGDTHITVRCGSDFYSWGINSHGQLGIELDNSTDLKYMSTPTRVRLASDLWSEADLLRSILVAGGRHVIVAVRHKLWSWGWNKYGQVGCGSKEEIISIPTVVKLEGADYVMETVKCGKEVAAHITQVVTGWRHTLVMTKGGQLYAWGKPGMHGALVLPPNPNSKSQPPKKPVEKKLSLEDETEIEEDLTCYHWPSLVKLGSAMSTIPVLSLFSSSSNSVSLTAIDLLEEIKTKENVNREKFVSTRSANKIVFHEGTLVQQELSRRIRVELGGWHQKEEPTSTVAEKEKVKENNAAADNKNDSKGVKLSIMKRQASPPKSALNASVAQIPNLEKTRRENLSHDGLQKLFSPVKTSGGYGYSGASLNKDIMEYFDIRDPAVDGGMDDEEMFSIQASSRLSATKTRAARRRASMTGGTTSNRRASTASPTTSSAFTAPKEAKESALARFNRKRNSISTTQPTKDFQPAPVSQGSNTIGTKQIVNKPFSKSAPMAMASTPSKKKPPASQAEIEKKKRFGHLGNELNNLKRDVSNRDSSKYSRRYESSEASREASSEIFGNGDGLSLVTVSDLATMIQSIKKESLKEMSMTWRH